MDLEGGTSTGLWAEINFERLGVEGFRVHDAGLHDSCYNLVPIGMQLS